MTDVLQQKKESGGKIILVQANEEELMGESTPSSSEVLPGLQLEHISITENPVISNPSEWSSDEENIFRQPTKLRKKTDGPLAKDAFIRCKFCHNHFSRKSVCTRHELNCPLNTKKGKVQFSCPQCKKLFIRKDNLNSHLKKCISKTRRSQNNEENCDLNDAPITCKFCQNQFNKKKYCIEHEKKCNANPMKSPPKFQCAHCESKFDKKFSLSLHLQKCSPEKPQKPVCKAPCLVKNCHASFYHKSNLIKHFSSTHKNEIVIKSKVTKTFTSIEEFRKWKELEEESTFSFFTARRGTKGKTQIFYCQHDGSGKSHLKSKGRKTSRRRHLPTVKVGHHCISKIKVTETDDKTILVAYYPTHSHDCKQEDLLHHGIPLEMSKFIDEKINQKIPPATIYELAKERFLPKNNASVYDSKAGNLTRGLVLERARRRREALQLHKDDAKSVYLLTAQHIEKDNSILLYKPLGADIVHGPEEINGLPDSQNLFMFGFQTQSQLDLMIKHCGKIIIVDETHGTNQYNFQLLTVMVIDENHRGWPVAHLITSKSDANTLRFFFYTLGLRLQHIQPSIINCVITDDDSALINAMEEGFGQTLTHILCKWHVIKNLKENLRSKVPKDLVNEMFAEIKVILNATDEKLFLKLKNGFQNKYDSNPDVAEYLSYLDSYYWNRAGKWAMCYRNFPHGNVNTTGHLESFHNRFKSSYLSRIPNKRCDDLINLLYDVAWYDECTRSREAKVGFSVQPQQILQRHTKGLLLEDSVIIQQAPESGLWEVKSGSGNGTYFITRQMESCNFELCFSKCTKVECHSLCSHLLSCSCPDHHPLCKHIHKLQSFLFRNVPRDTIQEDFYNFETVRSLEIYDEPNYGDNDCVEESSIASDKKYKILREKIASHVAKLQKFMAQNLKNVPEHRLRKVEATLSTLQPYLELEEPKVAVCEMKPAVKFAPNEKLKTQASQLAAFKRPSKKRRTDDISSLALKKQQAIENLSLYADKCSSDDSDRSDD